MWPKKAVIVGRLRILCSIALQSFIVPLQLVDCARKFEMYKCNRAGSASATHRQAATQLESVPICERSRCAPIHLRLSITSCMSTHGTQKGRFHNWKRPFYSPDVTSRGSGCASCGRNAADTRGGCDASHFSLTSCSCGRPERFRRRPQWRPSSSF